MTRSDFDRFHTRDHVRATPHGHCWDAPIENTTLAFFDLEMTGLDPTRDKIVEVAIVRVANGAIVDVLESLVNPGIEMTDEALAIHRIAAESLTSAPLIDTIAPRIQDILADAVPIGHGTDLDAEFIAHEMPHTPTLEPCLDTLTLARRALSAPSYTLAALTAKLGLPARRWHRALEDALAVRALFEKLVVEFGATSARNLWQVHVGQRERVVVRDDVSNALMQLEKSGSRCEITVRTPAHDPKTYVALVERWASPHAHLWLPDRHVLRVVRADRILRVRAMDAQR